MIITLPRPIALKPKKTLSIFPLGDIQSDQQLDRLIELVEWSQERLNEGVSVLCYGTGDYYETTSPSERVKLAGANLHDSTYETLNKSNMEQADNFIEIMKPLKGKVISLLKGHHSAQLRFEIKKKGEQTTAVVKDSEEYIAEKLGAEYAGDGVQLIDMMIAGCLFRIMTMHGYGSARTEGARVMKRMRMNAVIGNCHWYAMAHDNDKVSYPKEPLFVSETKRGEIYYLKQYFTGCGSFQESYLVGNLAAGYAEKLALPPSALGVVIMSIRYNEKKMRLDYHISN